MDECNGPYKFVSSQPLLESLLLCLGTQANKFFTFYAPFDTEEQNNLYFAHLCYYLTQTFQANEISIDHPMDPEVKANINNGDGILLPGDNSRLITFRDEKQLRGHRREIDNSNERENNFYQFYCDFIQHVQSDNVKSIQSIVNLPGFRIFPEITSDVLKGLPVISKGSYGTVKKWQDKAIKQPRDGIPDYDINCVKDEFSKSVDLVREIDRRIQESFSDEYDQRNILARLQSISSVNLAEGQTPNGYPVQPFVQ